MMREASLAVLLLDDSQKQYIFLQDMLGAVMRQPFTLDWVPSIARAHEKLSQQHYDICLVDYDLGDDDETGLDFIAQINQQGLRLPMILLTGHGNRQVDLQAMQAGAMDYLDKGRLSPDGLERSIRYAVERAHAEQALRASEARFRNLIATVPAGIFIYQDDQLRYVNDMFAVLTDYRREELIGRDFLHLIAPGTRATVRQWVPSSWNGYQPSQSEVPILTGRGKLRWVNLSLSNIDYEGGPAVLGAVIDISKRREMEQAEQEQRVLAEALVDTAQVLNSTLNINEVLVRILTNVGNVIQHDTANIMLIEEGYTRVVGYRANTDTDGISDTNGNSDQREHEQLVRRLRFIVRDSPSLQHMIETGKPLLITDVQHSGLTTERTGAIRLRSYLGAPIAIEGTVIGFINLDSRSSGFFTQRHAERLQDFTNQAALAIKNAQVYQQAQELAAAEERQRLARDLHDAVSQTLFSANVMAETLPRLMHNNQQAAVQGLQRLGRLTKGALAEMRALLVELRPAALVETELRVLLGHLINGLRARCDCEIELSVAGNSYLLTPDVQVGLYRIAQEALNNVLKHAQAQHINVTLTYRPGRVMLSVIDDGVGFDVDAVPADHMGVHIMHERAQAIGAVLHLNSQLGEGTSLTVTWSEQV